MYEYRYQYQYLLQGTVQVLLFTTTGMLKQYPVLAVPGTLSGARNVPNDSFLGEVKYHSVWFF